MIKTTVNIDGMMCGMCESHINDVIRKKFKVKKVSSSHKKGETVILSDDKLDKKVLKDTIEETGYQALNIQSDTYVKKGFFPFG